MFSNIKVIPNKIIPFPGFLAINLFGTIFVRRSKKWWEANKNSYKMQIMLNHERIHTMQAHKYRTKWFAFYIVYLVQWVKNLFKYRFNFELAYVMIPFEYEAYKHEHDFSYQISNK